MSAISDNPPTGPTYVIEGFGAGTTGGDQPGQVILTVSNLNDTGPGSLRDAIENHTGPRLIIFSISGNIALTKDISVESGHGNFTVDGSDAPNQGICLKGGGIYMHFASNVILRHIRIRPGSTQPNPDTAHAFLPDTSTSNIVLDHCSLSWAVDQVTGTSAACTNITFQWCFITEGLDQGHSETNHSDAFLGTDLSTNITIHHCYFSHSRNRNPLFNGKNDVDFVNNVVYDPGTQSTVIEPDTIPSAPGQGGIRANLVNNYYKEGPCSIPLANGALESNKRNITLRGGLAFSSVSSVYVAGNIGTNAPTGNENQALVYDQDNGGLTVNGSRFNFPLVTTSTAAQAKIDVLAHAGATLPCRDSGDRKLVTQLDNGLIRSNTLQAGSTTSTVVFDSGASSVTGTYVGFWVALPGFGFPDGIGRLITAYDGPSRRATIETSYHGAYHTSPNAGQAYRIYNGGLVNTEADIGGYPDLTQPVITYYVRTDGGTSAQATGTVNAPYPGVGLAQPCAFNNPQDAIDVAVGGDIIGIRAGDSFSGNFTLRNHN